MSATMPTLRHRSPKSDVSMVLRQVSFEQRSFWRTPQSAIFTFALPMVLLVLITGLNQHSHYSQLRGIKPAQYFLPATLSYGVMGACFSSLAISISFRRELGILKRVRGTPLPPWAFFAGVIGNAVCIVAIQVIIALAIGHFAYGVKIPTNIPALILALLIGVVTFSALGLAVSTFVSNAESAPAVVNLPYFVLTFLSGVFYPISNTGFVSKLANFFPMAHFIKAMFAPFVPIPGYGAVAGGDLRSVAIWGAAGLLITVRRFRWEPTSS